jgi:hypothetical protein
MIERPALSIQGTSDARLAARFNRVKGRVLALRRTA